MDLVGDEHPHEPSIPPALDDEGRCLVCGLFVKLSEAERKLAAAVEEIERLREALQEILRKWHGEEGADLNATDDFLSGLAVAADIARRAVAPPEPVAGEERR